MFVLPGWLYPLLYPPKMKYEYAILIKGRKSIYFNQFTFQIKTTQEKKYEAKCKRQEKQFAVDTKKANKVSNNKCHINILS